MSSNPFIVSVRAPTASTSDDVTRRMNAIEQALEEIKRNLRRLEEEVEDMPHARGPSFCLGS